MNSLLIDLGNTRCKLAVCEQGVPTHVEEFANDEWTKIEAYLLRHGSAVMATLVSSVGDTEQTATITTLAERASGRPVRLVRPTDKLPFVENGYRKPEQLGVDRLMAMVAARAHAGGPLCVIDAGTAVTIDFVTAGGRHLGGFILPGWRLARDCLLARTSIPRDSAVDPDADIGRDTPTAVALGARYGVATLVQYFTAGAGALFPGQPVDVIVGGGGAAELLPLLPSGCITLPHLVLQGLAMVAVHGSD